ncbi:hypothetical protein [Nonomuraea sp. NPDC046570]|uniref:hypothetical protein n=1 Tax=Nonomuraea sp. NPDC046570 TaxID=3155255 RepID=UPI0034107691
MQGAEALPDQEVLLADGAVRLTLEEGPTLDVTALDLALIGDRTESWTGVTVGRGEPFDSMHVWIATVDDRFGMIWHDRDRDCVLVVELAMRWYCPVLITPDSFAYLAIREIPRAEEGAERRWEFGVCGYGPASAELAHQLHDHVRTWDRDWRPHPIPTFTLYPVDAARPVPTVGRIFRKRHTQLVLNWR